MYIVLHHVVAPQSIRNATFFVQPRDHTIPIFRCSLAQEKTPDHDMKDRFPSWFIRILKYF